MWKGGVNMSKNFVAIGTIWVILCFAAGIVLLLTPTSQKPAGEFKKMTQGRNTAGSYVVGVNPDDNAKTQVHIAGTPEGLVETKVEIKK